MSLESPARPKFQISISYTILAVFSIYHLAWLLPAMNRLHTEYDAIDLMQTQNAESYTQTIPLTKGSPAIVLMKDDPFRINSRWMYVSSRNLLPANYQPPVLEKLSVPEAASSSPMFIAPIVNDALVKMFKAAENDGIPLIISSAYRSNEDQKVLYGYYVATMGQEAAEAYVAEPAASEHATGLAVDINTYTEDCKIGLTLCAINGPTASWLKINAPTYGFILRYPEGKEAITGVASESWHFRFVGNGALPLTNAGLTLDELVQRVQPELLK